MSHDQWGVQYIAVKPTKRHKSQGGATSSVSYLVVNWAEFSIIWEGNLDWGTVQMVWLMEMPAGFVMIGN